MRHLAPAGLLSALEWRYAAKSFDPTKKIPGDVWAALEKALVLTPSSYGLQPWRFLVIQDEPIRERLRVASWNQRQVTECSHYVVMAQRLKIDEEYVDRYLASISATRNVPLESLAGLRKSIVGDVVHGLRSKQIQEWAARQVYIALGNFMTAAAVVGVDACPMEGFEPAKYDEILGLPEAGFSATVACAAGYRNPADRFAAFQKVRFPVSDIVENR